MIPKFRFFGRVADGEMRMVMAEAIDFTSGFVYYSYHDYTVEGDDNVYGDTVSFENCVLMQSTGLFDVNGKEIFEGDVVELHHFTENYSTTGGFYEGEESLVGVVRYGYTDDEIKYFGKVYPPRWFLENRYRKLDFSDLSGLHEESFKVIGNIYQNKELKELGEG